MLPYDNYNLTIPPDLSKNEIFARNILFLQQMPKLCEKLIFITTFKYSPDKESAHAVI